ncbi:hypothetical protein PybrP1_013018 [[Pythium] brassicae (nom. inval.)]|nr:hypothetical protein PybrP1_013018 [[Pythium] brassicae (nom. inval.)]
MVPPTSKRAYKSLQYFLNRASVLTQYREFLRTTRPLAPDTRRDVRRQIRAGFEAQRLEADDQRVSQLLRGAREQLKMVSDLVDTATARQRLGVAVGSDTTSQSPAPKAEATMRPELRSVVSHSAGAQETWTEQVGSDPDDVKGRVGTGWPWKSSQPPKKLELEGIKRRYGTRSFLEES